MLLLQAKQNSHLNGMKLAMALSACAAVVASQETVDSLESMVGVPTTSNNCADPAEMENLECCELDDNGCAKLSVKMRAMPSGFFILLRFYLRVDKTLIRVHDTRLRYEEGADFILREYSEREQKVEELKVGREIWTDHNEIVNHLPVSLMQVEKLLLPAA